MTTLPDERLETPSQPPPIFVPALTALFLDLDGALAPIEPTPDAVRPDARRTRILRRLVDRLDGRVAVLSGREIAEVDRILEGSVTAVAGMHGLQRRDTRGRTFHTPPHPALAEAAETLALLARADRGLLLERKGASVALHYRAKPDAGPAVIDCARRIARQSGLVLQEGRMVAELRTPGPDKGVALGAFMSEKLFSGTAPMMIGDDLTDEDAFAAADLLGGDGILIGDPRPSRARWRLAGPEALLDWLEDQLPAPGHAALAEEARP